MKAAVIRCFSIFDTQKARKIGHKREQKTTKEIKTLHRFKNLKINVFDLNIILGNLLNNAIEAIEKAERKYFFINIYFEKNILFIHIENTYDGNIIKEKETLMTTKEEKQLHGLGLKSVSSILEKYDGDIIYDYNDIYFITDVMLCNTSFHHETA